MRHHTIEQGYAWAVGHPAEVHTPVTIGEWYACGEWFLYAAGCIGPFRFRKDGTPDARSVRYSGLTREGLALLGRVYEYIENQLDANGGSLGHMEGDA